MKKIKSENYFYAINGSVLKSKEDLLKFLKKTDESSFHHHVNAEKNDFASWTKAILKDSKLAKKLSKTQNIEDMITTLEEALHKKKKKKSRKKVISEIVKAIKKND